MRRPAFKVSVRWLMVAVALVAGLLGLAVAFDYQWRPDLHGLRVGRVVVITGPHVVDLSGGAVGVGARAVVKADDWDEKGSISGRREVLVTTATNVVARVRRDELRPVKEAW